jgi:2-desacetyl-2-hydroxyethyl bacteriochlorophyllide A dehydrogenase
LLGWSEPWNGGYAGYISVPARNILQLADSVSLEAGVILLDTIGTAWHALRQAAVGDASNVLVIGCGPLGLGAITGAIAFGAAKVYASDLSPYRRAAAEDLGANAVTPETLDSLEGCDVIIEAAGTQQTLMQAVHMVVPGGRVVLLGEIWTPWLFEPTEFNMLKDYSIIRSWYFPITDFDINQQCIVDGSVPLDKLVSHTFPLEELEAAFSLFFSGNSRKVLSAS